MSENFISESGGYSWLKSLEQKPLEVSIAGEPSSVLGTHYKAENCFRKNSLSFDEGQSSVVRAFG